MSVGVAVIDGLSVAVGFTCVALAQETIKNIPMIAITGNAKGRDLRDSMFAPLKADMRMGKKRTFSSTK